MAETSDSLRIVGYVRVSTMEQSRHGESIDTQKARIRRFLHDRDMELVDIISDDGKSGKSLKREGFQEVLRMLRAGEVDGLCVSRLDRMTRRVRHLLELVEDLFIKEGRHLISVAEQIDTNTPVGRACLAIIAALAQLEREQIAERVHEVLQEKIRRGERAGAVPYGFELDPADPTGKKLLPQPDEQAVIELQKTLRARGWSYKRIADELSRKGIPTKSGKSKWIHTAVRRILKRPEGYREGDDRTDPRGR
jgi:site-specific DNA recombinase